jgi:hypothetical protein
MKGARQMPGVLVKMPQELKISLNERAQHSFRSLNAEIVMRLSTSLEAEKEKASNA